MKVSADMGAGIFATGDVNTDPEDNRIHGPSLEVLEVTRNGHDVPEEEVSQEEAEEALWKAYAEECERRQAQKEDYFDMVRKGS